MADQIEIRKAQASDYEAYCSLVSEVDSLHTEKLPWHFQDPGMPPRKREFFEGLLAAEDKDVFVATLDALPVGYLQMEARNVGGLEILVPTDYAYVADVVVKKTAQRRGIGSALMRQAEIWAKQRGLNQLRLNVWSFNRSAIEFYEALGMQVGSQTMIKRL
jgi:ribosomal protein S18 acetylase RimI-like enzyme